jgi:hypothetical protein
MTLEGFQAQAVVLNVEALSEFKELTNNTSAEYGYRVVRISSQGAWKHEPNVGSIKLD